MLGTVHTAGGISQHYGVRDFPNPRALNIKTHFSSYTVALNLKNGTQSSVFAGWYSFSKDNSGQAQPVLFLFCLRPECGICGALCVSPASVRPHPRSDPRRLKDRPRQPGQTPWCCPRRDTLSSQEGIGVGGRSPDGSLCLPGWPPASTCSRKSLMPTLSVPQSSTSTQGPRPVSASQACRLRQLRLREQLHRPRLR